MAIPASIRPRFLGTCGSPSAASCTGTGAAHRSGGTGPADRSRGALLAFLATAVLLAGCGQRGPLYLPDQAPPKKRFASAAQDQGQVRPASVAAALPSQATGSAERPTRNRS